ncbi:hypothetical protein COCNU_scaffold005839G000010 [Cocos nucifera]|nr:hypothetical protein [Cocos nucifera]
MGSLKKIDTEATGMLTKRLYAQKRKEKASGGSSKRVKVGPSSGDQAPKLPTEGETRIGKKKKKAIAKTPQVEKVQEDLRAEVSHLQKKVDELEHLAEDKTTKIRSLQGTLRKEEFISARLKAALALEEERKKEAKIKVIELEAQMAKSFLKMMIQAMEEFKASSKMRNLNVEFGQQAFIKGFELCEGQVARKFLELDLSFLKEEQTVDGEAKPSTAVVDPSLIGAIVEPSEPCTEELGPSEPPIELALESAATIGESSSPAASPLKIGSF